MSDFVGGPIRRNGGKTHVAKRIIDHFPNAYHYAEPFFGAGGMYFSVPQDLYKVRSFNDIDNLIISFFKELRDNPEELQRVCSLTPYADRELKEAASLVGANIRAWKTEYDRKIHVALELGSLKKTRSFNEMDMEPDEVLADLLGTLMELKELEDKYG